MTLMTLIQKRKQIIDNLKKVFDPEMPVNIWDLGLIYAVDLNSEDCVTVVMTFTSPNCPSAEEIMVDVKLAVLKSEFVKECQIQIVWQPAWNSNNLDEELKLELGLF